MCIRDRHCKWIPFIEGLRYLNTIFHRIQTVNTSVILSGQGCSRNDQTDSTKYWEGDQAIDQVSAVAMTVMELYTHEDEFSLLNLVLHLFSPHKFGGRCSGFSHIKQGMDIASVKPSQEAQDLYTVAWLNHVKRLSLIHISEPTRPY